MTNLRTIIESTLVPHTAFVTASARLEQCFDYANDALEPICLPILGESRTGKSRSLESFMLNHPRTRSADGMKIPVLSTKAPAKPTVKGLAEQMLLKIGDPMFNKGTELTKTQRLQMLMEQCGTKMVIVDEFQHFIDKGSAKVAYHVADWLKILVDECKVAVVVAGLPSCRGVLEQNSQLDGRFMAPVVMPRFDWANGEHRDEFVAILGAFEESIAKHFELPNLTSDEMAFRVYCATGGLIGYLAKILRTSVWNAVDGKQHSIDLTALRVAHLTSVGSPGSVSNLIDPFSSSFEICPSTDLLQRVAKIGIASEPASTRRGAAQRRKTTEGDEK